MSRRETVAILLAPALAALFACGAVQPGETQDAETPGGGNDGGSSVTDGAADSTPADATRAQDASPADAGSVDGTLPFDAAPDASATCTPQEQADRWALMDSKSIVLPNRAAGLDLKPPDAGLLTLPQAEAILCPSTDAGDLMGNGRRVAVWGSQQEVMMQYDPVTLAGDTLLLSPGYQGPLQFHSPDNTSSYTILVYGQIKKNGQPFNLDPGWTSSAFAAEIDELYRGLIATFAPTVPLDPPGVTCLSTAKCVVAHFGATAQFYVAALRFDFWTFDVTAAPSFTGRIDVY